MHLCAHLSARLSVRSTSRPADYQRIYPPYLPRPCISHAAAGRGFSAPAPKSDGFSESYRLGVLSPTLKAVNLIRSSCVIFSPACKSSKSCTKSEKCVGKLFFPGGGGVTDKRVTIETGRRDQKKKNAFNLFFLSNFFFFFSILSSVMAFYLLLWSCVFQPTISRGKGSNLPSGILPA